MHRCSGDHKNNSKHYTTILHQNFNCFLFVFLSLNVVVFWRRFCFSIIDRGAGQVPVNEPLPTDFVYILYTIWQKTSGGAQLGTGTCACEIHARQRSKVAVARKAGVCVCVVPDLSPTPRGALTLSFSWRRRRILLNYRKWNREVTR